MYNRYIRSVDKTSSKAPTGAQEKGLFSLLHKYIFLISMLLLLTIVAIGLSLYIPTLISKAIDTYTKGGFNMMHVVIEFSIISILVFYKNLQLKKKSGSRFAK